ncbi:transcriptional regulator [Actinoplanes sp. ATCC 53533]|uniref:helix-turn-helix domain-containing protein n=1 Tax=Actinoplanes sp. ATCC 53533 TaxID=1288362 RepID=UPI000F791ED9|nr:helix-turn-helix transcriptional regulator [Actinoplanes sp. ATCC 53533]RSM68447.1 transcriptional regulator [Actinoplanes sp. ATCC 53533]
MAEAVSPTVARRRVRLALREAREAAELTQQQVADQMEWSLSKVIRIENGDVSIAPNDLRPLLGYLGIKDKSVVSALLIDARTARTRQRQAWYQKPQMRELLSDPYRKLIEYEAEATAIRYFSINFFPGPMQLPAYSEALFRPFGDEIPEEKVQVLLEARRLRREALLSRAGSVELFVLLDESVLMRTIGGLQVFTDQLRETHRLATSSVIKLRMIRFDSDLPMSNNATFDLLSLDTQDAEGMLLYRENGLTDEVVETQSSTRRHRSRYDKLWQETVHESDTIDFVQARIRTLEAAAIDRRQKPQ